LQGKNVFVLDSTIKYANWPISNYVFALRKCFSSLSSLDCCHYFSQEENNWLNEEADKVRAETVENLLHECHV
jgi:hypothetical protein